jgi:DNA-binding transcriptional ArsR family regulator
MMKIFKDGKSIDAMEVDAKTLSAINPERLAILKALVETPRHATQLAKDLRMHPQTVYYHLRILAKEKLIYLERFEQKSGGITKQYAAATTGLALPLTNDYRPFHENRKKTPAFLEPFVSEGYLDAKMVVGSPEPHGQYRTRGSELAAIELSAYIGQYAAFEYPLYYLDTEVREKMKKQNLILVGGPKVNMLTREFNAHLPIRFAPNFDIHSTLSGKKYGEDVGIIEVAENPLNPAKKILVAAGLSQHTTRVAVLALIKKAKPFSSAPFAHVVQGFDEDGDGIVDQVDVLE